MPGNAHGAWLLQARTVGVWQGRKTTGAFNTLIWLAAKL